MSLREVQKGSRIALCSLPWLLPAGAFVALYGASPPVSPAPATEQRPAGKAKKVTNGSEASLLPNAGLLPERALAARQACELLDALRAGRLRLTVPAREGGQLRRLGQEGVYRWPALPRRTSSPPLLSATISPEQAYEAALAEALANTAFEFRNVRALPSRKAVPNLRALFDEAVVEPAPPSPDLMRALLVLAKRSDSRHPLELMTLLRPPYRAPDHPHGSPTNSHSLGLAADIAAYDGHRITLSRPEECVAMTLALLRDLPPGRYRLGLPKAPEMPPVVGQPRLNPALAELIAAFLPPEEPRPFSLLAAPAFSATPVPTEPEEALAWLSSALSSGEEATKPPAFRAAGMGVALGIYAGQPPRAWPFFPAQEVEIIGGVVAPLRRDGKVVVDAAGRPVPHIVRFRNEGYAPEEALGDARVRSALAAARKRGVQVYALMPDAADHVHVDLRPEPPRR